MVRYGSIFFLAVALIAGPTYFLIRGELSDPDNLIPGVAVMLLAPAVGWVVPLAVMLLFLWWRDITIKRGHGALVGALAVVTYVIAVSMYFLIAGRFHGFGYIVTRLAFSLPSIVIAACFTELASWLMF